MGLIPVFMLAQKFALGNPAISDDASMLINQLARINLGLLIFNVLPVYPLDGGQILRSLLWFVIGPVKSLLVATFIGFLGAAGLAYLAFEWESIWVGVMAVFMYMNCRAAWNHARAMSAQMDLR